MALCLPIACGQSNPFVWPETCLKGCKGERVEHLFSFSVRLTHTLAETGNTLSLSLSSGHGPVVVSFVVQSLWQWHEFWRRQRCTDEPPSHSHRHRQTDRQTDRRANRQTDKQIEEVVWLAFGRKARMAENLLEKSSSLGEICTSISSYRSHSNPLLCLAFRAGF